MTDKKTVDRTSDNESGIKPGSNTEIESGQPKKSIWKKFFLVFRLPFDLIFISIDFFRVMVWLMFRAMLRIMAVPSKSRCPFFNPEKGMINDKIKCVHSRLYGMLPIFHAVCPQALPGTENPDIIICKRPGSRLKFGLLRFIGLGTALTLIWGSLAFGIVMLTPARKVLLDHEKRDLMLTSKKEKCEQAEKFYENAQKLYQADEYTKARIEYLNAVQRNPENAGYHAGLGNVSLKIGDMGTAELHLKKAVDLDPTIAKAHTGLGYLALVKRNIEQAFVHGKKALELGDGGKDLFFLLAECHLSRSESEEAEAMIEKGLNEDADSDKTILQVARFYTRTRSLKKAVATYDRLLKKFPDNITAGIELAVIYRQQRKFDKAKKVLEKVLEKDFLNVSARSELAEILLARGRLKEAIEAYSQIVVEQSNAVRAAARLAELYVFSGQVNKGLSTAKKVLTIYPDNPEANLVMARIFFDLNIYIDTIRYCRQGLRNKRRLPELSRLLISALIRNESFKDAEENVKNGLKLNPDDIFLSRMKCMIRWREGYPDDAVSCASNLAKKHPESAFPDVFMASIRIEQKLFKKAIAHYEDAIKKAPEDMEIMNNLAHLLASHTDKIGRAEKLARKVKSIMPGDPIAADTLGWVYYHKRNYKKAISELYFAAQKMGQNPTIRYHLAAAYHKTGRMKESKAELKAALALSNDFDEVGRARDLLARIQNRK
ncbi:tetratricopeptide repeat protein [Desulfobacterales bacterium HSG16]|nr:tetratricopeptide repeat protein [Desulfobacterales bacterium HSG16]